MITIKLNLRQLKHAMTTTPKGNRCIIIPVDENKLFVGKDEKAIYLDVVGFDYTPKNADDKNTHLLKQSFPKDYLAALSEEQRKLLPILGNARVSGAAERSDPEPQTAGEVAPEALPPDMPF